MYKGGYKDNKVRLSNIKYGGSSAESSGARFHSQRNPRTHDGTCQANGLGYRKADREMEVRTSENDIRTPVAVVGPCRGCLCQFGYLNPNGDLTLSSCVVLLLAILPSSSPLTDHKIKDGNQEAGSSICIIKRRCQVQDFSVGLMSSFKFP